MSRSAKLQRGLHAWKFDRTRRAAARRFRPLIELLESYQLLSAITFTVTSAADNGNSATTPNDGTLRGAIEAANEVGAGNSAIIDFDIEVSGVQTITLFAGESLPSIDVPTQLDGFSQGGAGYGGSPLIVIDGSAVPGANGITLDGNASNTTIEGLSIVNFHDGEAPSPPAVSGAGIYLTAQVGNDLIAGNYLGILPDGTTVGSNEYGIAVSSSGNTIGGAGAGVDNVISGNRTGGIALFGQLIGETLSPVLDTVIEGNDIGTDATGTTAKPNGTSPTTTVNGGPGPGYGIGLAGASDTTIGGTNVDDGNVISGNSGYGIFMTQFVGDISSFDNTSDEPVPTTGNLVEGNLIGTAASGTAAVGNSVGVVMAGAAQNTIGGTTPGATNVISGNGPIVEESVGVGPATEGGESGIGVAIVGDDAFNDVSNTADVVEGNFIGTDVTGNSPLGNSADGIYVGDVSAFDTTAAGVASGATIGGPAIGAGNVISANRGDGVEIDGTALAGSVDDVVQGNSIGIYYNGLFGGDPPTSGNALIGVSANDLSGLAILANDIENSGSQGIYVFNATGTSIGGTAAGAGNLVNGNGGVGVEVSATNTASAFPASMIGNSIEANGADGILVTGGIVTVAIQGNEINDNTGNGIEIDGESNITIGGLALVASNIIAGNAANGILIDGTSTALPSAGDFIDGNQIGIPGEDVIVGPDGEAGDGNAEAGISATNTSGLTLLGNTIENNHTIGITVQSSTGTTIGGSAAGAGNVIAANGGFGIQILGSASAVSNGDLIDDNLIGVLANGDVVGNHLSGIYATHANGLIIVGNTVEASGRNDIEDAATAVSAIEILASTGTTIGGTAPGAGNVIANNSGDGIQLAGTEILPSTGDLIEGNLIGVLTNSGTPVSGNGNGSDGVYAAYTSGLEIFGNAIEENGQIEGNSRPGVAVINSTGATIGGTAAGAANVIADNGEDGLDLLGDRASFVVGNTINSNGSTGVFTSSSGSGTQILGNTIDGNVANGIFLSAGILDFTIQGNTIESNQANGVNLHSVSGVTIGGTAAGAGNVISNNAHVGLYIDGVHGADVIGNTIASNGSTGISANALSGSSALFADNVIESNDGAGIFLLGSSVTVTIQGNDIEGNSGAGVAIGAEGSSGAISATTPGNTFAVDILNNTVENNGGAGIYVTRGIVTVTVQGNDIENNSFAGVGIAYEDNVTVGGTAAGEGNTIAGNATMNGSGIDLVGSSRSPLSGDMIAGNLIGVLPASGTPSLATGNGSYGIFAQNTPGLVIIANTIEENASDGIDVLSSDGVTIGGSTEGAGNTIAANGGSGIDMEGSSDGLVQDNLIGVLASGAPAGNGINGVGLEKSDDTLIVGNTVENNGTAIDSVRESRDLCPQGRSLWGHRG